MREIIIGHVELTLIFLFDDFLCKIAILEPLKVRFLDKKQKLLSDDGIYNRLESCELKFSYLSLLLARSSLLRCTRSEMAGGRDLRQLSFR